MEKEIPLYESIYNKIVNRVLIGIYPKGYQLASVQKIHARYGVGFTSIRRAMRLLEQDGFIRQEERKRPVVVFDLADPACRQLRWRIFLSHRDAHLDCYRAIPFLLPGLVSLGAQAHTPELLESLDALCARAQEGEELFNRYDLLSLVYTWQSLVVQQSGNSLASDLFLQIRGFDELRFHTLPSAELVPGEVQATLQTLRYWTGLLRRGDLIGLHTMTSIFCLQVMSYLDRSFRPLAELPELEHIRQVDFRWYLYQSPTPLYKKIAYDLLRSAYWEGMGDGDGFPSEAALMERYHVAAVTVRGAAALLNGLGMAQTVNGVGTLFTGSQAETDELTPYLRECRESMEILAACSYALALNAGPGLSRQELSLLREELPEYRSQEGAALFLLRKLASAVPGQALETVLEQLEGRYIFGLYASGLPFLPGRRERLNSAFLQADACLSCLESGDPEGFALGLSSLFRELCRELPALSGEA